MISSSGSAVSLKNSTLTAVNKALVCQFHFWKFRNDFL